MYRPGAQGYFFFSSLLSFFSRHSICTLGTLMRMGQRRHISTCLLFTRTSFLFQPMIMVNTTRDMARRAAPHLSPLLKSAFLLFPPVALSSYRPRWRRSRFLSL